MPERTPPQRFTEAGHSSLEMGVAAELLANPPAFVGLRLRFFSRRVFGAWVDATVVRVDRKRKRVRLQAEFHGARWLEWLALGASVYRPSEHPNRGGAFVLS